MYGVTLGTTPHRTPVLDHLYSPAGPNSAPSSIPTASRLSQDQRTLGATPQSPPPHAALPQHIPDRPDPFRAPPAHVRPRRPTTLPGQPPLARRGLRGAARAVRAAPGGCAERPGAPGAPGSGRAGRGSWEPAKVAGAASPSVTAPMACKAAAAAQAEAAVGGGGGQTPTMQPGKQPWRRRRRRPRPPAPTPEPLRAVPRRLGTSAPLAARTPRGRLRPARVGAWSGGLPPRLQSGPRRPLPAHAQRLPWRPVPRAR